MPELPEVETTLRGIRPFLLGETIADIIIRQRSLRWPVTEGIETSIRGSAIKEISRRAKYLQFHLDNGSMLVHLGMSGSLRVLKQPGVWKKHDHIELKLNSGNMLRYHDPRRFGSWLWSQGGHWQLEKLGPEPLSEGFDGAYLYRLSKRRQVAVKAFIMNNSVVVGVGNIYASESLFLSGIRPDRPAGRISKKRYTMLADNIKITLKRAIDRGGTTLRDYSNGNGDPGYFKQELFVYARNGLPCLNCLSQLTEKRIGQRSSVFCMRCQV